MMMDIVEKNFIKQSKRVCCSEVFNIMLCPHCHSEMCVESVFIYGRGYMYEARCPDCKAFGEGKTEQEAIDNMKRGNHETNRIT